jgi:ATP-dependent DNA helicase RecG
MNSVSDIKGVGESVAKKLEILGIKTIDDLVWNFPRRYEDYSQISSISELRPGSVSIECKIKQAKGRYVRRGMHITEAIASDDTGSVRLIWFNQPYRANAIKSDQKYFVSGNYELSRQRFAIMNPSMEMASEFPINTARIVPIYRETKGLKSATIRKIMRNIRDEIIKWPEVLPSMVVKEQGLMLRHKAITQLHFPTENTLLDRAKHRLGFEEVFGLTLAALLNKQENQTEKAPRIEFDEAIAKKFVSKLPFELTSSQRKVIWQTYLDMQRTIPMNRLIEGDVGSGKTVVAAMAAIMAMSKGYQVAFMAPTELLARQHANTLHRMLEPLDLSDQIALLVGSMKPAEKERARSKIKTGDCKLMVGTHALITDKIDMHNLALAIVDEQHRFGVKQRQKLTEKAGHMPHLMSMTATPIPRTLALTLYGELDISILHEKPADRTPILTEIISPNSRVQLYKKIEKELEAGRQMFVVCPLISESDVVTALSAERVFEDLAKKSFKHRRVGLLHGKLKANEKEEVMQKFVSGMLDILVSTTVVEVGVDVPNATVMMIEGAERFGLAQIHQLRGRVGRSEHQGHCYLIMSDSSAPTQRLKAVESSTDGFKLAEMDLEIRGPGAIYGQMQHGQLDLRIANLSDTKLIARAREAAQKFLDNGEKLNNYPELADHVGQYRSITALN